MHIVLDARTATPHFPGIGRYVTNLGSAIAAQLGTGERLTVLHRAEHSPRLPISEAVRAAPLEASPFSLAQQWAAPRLLRELNASVYHSPYYLMPYRPGAPTLLTVYDLIPLRQSRHSTARARLLFRWTTALALRAAAHVIAISEAARRDFVSEFGLPPDRITAIPLAADAAFRPQPPAAVAAFRARSGLPERFMLYLGSNKPHKNLVRLVEAWAAARSAATAPTSPAGGPGTGIVDLGLVIAGAWDARYPEARRLAEATAGVGSILWLGPVPEDDLPALYSAASAFVFPSLFEGFGLPVLEAMACGTPVICSDVSSLPEVTGGAALLVDPADAGSLAAAIVRLAGDESLRQSLREKGLARAARLTWRNTAAETLAIYRAIARGGLSK